MYALSRRFLFARLRANKIKKELENKNTKNEYPNLSNEIYLLVFFDYEDDILGEESLIEDTIEHLHTIEYRNLSIKLSHHCLLIKTFEDELQSYPYPFDIVDNVLVEQVRKFNLYQPKIAFYVLPVELESIEKNLIGLENEIMYLKQRKHN